eukprot:TRINITY_DN7125_c0_g1_i7.p1 TRINITY_DN7125_c0_g1~~TRINITY_DN7125_c0_g1_i7.p1  ORF type:complete len:216 (-),score=44.28 TRINITY_DN7125_c0_g1_i7:146-793(-)
MRRGVGVVGLQKQQQLHSQFRNVGAEMQQQQQSQLREQMTVFKKNLEDFAMKYKRQINEDPAFRMQFQKMCASIGVDPLASNKGFWAELLGFGDFYSELTVQVIQVCIATKSKNGGLIEISDLLKAIKKMRPSTAHQVSEDDVERVVKKIKLLGNGYDILYIGPKRFVQSVPCEFNTDHMEVLRIAEDTGYYTLSQLKTQLGWDDARIQTTMVQF